ncbi:MAG: sn-glycerol-3-phosphate ABC transporter ATP-binding protein UgpC [Betaproteobacteria bacterium]|nr:sn-glycerol-3-phosphate ABC transporter ATP-binding protein UgpC [Betaproteobacteria bacterium]
MDLEISDKEFMVLVGPSGCGKTTTLRMIAGLEEISDGEVYIGDHVVNDVPPKDRNIAMVFQNYALYPHMSVYENMSFGLKLKRVDKAEIDRRVQEAAKILDITTLLERKPKQLSGGQRQRVAMGRAIVRDPAVFLFDEPLSNLDAKLRVQMRTEIKKVHQKVRTTTVYVTHDQVEAMTLADRVVVMNHGVIEQVGTPQTLYHHPRTKFVAGFIGSPAMNFIAVQIVEQGSGLALDLGEGQRLLLPDEQAQRYRQYRDSSQLLLGIRPEHLTDSQSAGLPQTQQMLVTPEVCEPMGMETLVYFSLGGQSVCAKVNPDVAVQAGVPIALSAKLSNMHLIDDQNGLVL